MGMTIRGGGGILTCIGPVDEVLDRGVEQGPRVRERVEALHLALPISYMQNLDDSMAIQSLFMLQKTGFRCKSQDHTAKSLSYGV